MSMIIVATTVIASVLAWLTLFPLKELEKKDFDKRSTIVFILFVFVLSLVLMSIVNYFILIKTIGINIILLFLVMYALALACWLSLFGYHDSFKGYGIVIIVVIIILVIFILPMTQTVTLHNLAGVEEIEGKPLNIDSTHIRQVNYEYAKWKADKIIGALGDRVKLGELEIIIYNDRLTWVCPLIHRGFWKELDFDTISGYILVDGEDATIEPEMVDGLEIDISYENEYFGEYAHRIIYGLYPDYDQYWTFEIDDDGNPYLIVTLTQPTVYFTGDVPKIVMVMSPIDRTYNIYAFGSQPEWIDNAFPEELTEAYCKWWGKYKHGYWNTVFSEKDVKIPTGKVNANPTSDGSTTSGYSSVGIDVYMIVGNDGRSYWFTDFTSPSQSDQSMVGYMLIDTKTGDFKFYKSSGLLNGESAMEVATAKVKNYQGWYATQPLFLVIDGNETWFTPIHSGTNILQKFAFVRASDNYVVMGDSLDEILQEYGGIETVNISEELMITGIVMEINSYVVDGNTEWAIEIGDQTVYAHADTKPYNINVGDNITVYYRVEDISHEEDVYVAVEFGGS